MANLFSSSALRRAFGGKKAFVTGHTGFKGSWLAEWLLLLGARVTGYSLPPPPSPALFDQLGLGGRITHVEGDIRDAGALRAAVRAAAPDVVFHLAAQPLVRASYREPVATWETNVMGTLHLLEAVRSLGQPCQVVVVTTDKCYENREVPHGYREEDPLGGHDPYSSSKAAAEIGVSAWRRSFFQEGCVRVASARAGNVIGGGDWAEDRIVPDLVRSIRAGVPLRVRNPATTRPWQHVLEPLGGYLLLASRLAEEVGAAEAYNFGPGSGSNRPVRALVEESFKHWPGTWSDASDPAAPHEAGLLHLSSDKARSRLGWSPMWGFEEAVAMTMAWYRDVHAGGDPVALLRAQIGRHMEALA